MREVDPIFGVAALAEVARGCDAKLKREPKLREMAKYQAGSPELRHAMGRARYAQRKETLKAIWNPEEE